MKLPSCLSRQMGGLASARFQSSCLIELCPSIINVAAGSFGTETSAGNVVRFVLLPP